MTYINDQFFFSSLRFRAAQERMESIAKANQRGDVVDEENMFDSNCITPGTEFMEVCIYE